MSKIYVCGHKNPDVDCTSASVCYSHLKNTLNNSKEYIAVRCGHLNDQTKLAFKKAGIQVPKLLKTIEPKVEDINFGISVSLNPKDPIIFAIDQLMEKTISAVPVIKNDALEGILGVNELNKFFLTQQHSDTRPEYRFRVSNIIKVLKAECFQKGSQKEFIAPIMTGAMAHEDLHAHLKGLNTPPVFVMGRRKKLLDSVLLEQIPCLIFTGTRTKDKILESLKNYTGTVLLSPLDTAETVRLLRLSSPISSIMNKDYISVTNEVTFDSAKETLLSSSQRGLPVFKEDQFVGLVTRRNFINRPKKKLVLVDHNEIHQSIHGADQAEIIEIIDHHRFAAPKTQTPIHIYCKPLGSTCTLVFQQYQNNGITIPANIAILLMAGILSDTVHLKSPTTTIEDKVALQELETISGVNANSFAEELFSQLKELSTRDPMEVISSDFKTYSLKDQNFGIGQVEAVTLEGFEDIKEDYVSALNKQCKSQGLMWSMLLVTNVLKQESLLVTSTNVDACKQLNYQMLEQDFFFLPGVLSRKKQLLPEVFRVIDLVFGV